MARVVFFEKPGCGGNARQKALLQSSGHQVEARNLLTEPWTAEALRRFFGARPVEQWFNQSSPRVKSGEISPNQLSESEALELMLADPILIRRPLLRVDERYEAGFERDIVDAWIGLAKTPVTEDCIRKTAGAGADVTACKTDSPSRLSIAVSGQLAPDSLH